MKTSRDRLARWAGSLTVLTLANTAYLAGFPSATVFYMANVLLHLVLGSALAVLLAILLAANKPFRKEFRSAWVLFFAALAAAACLAAAGNLRENRWLLWIHIATAAGAIAASLPPIWRRGGRAPEWRRFGIILTGSLLLALLVPAGGHLHRILHPNRADRIVNPLHVPLSMAEEGGGPHSPFFPAAAETDTGRIIPADFFMESEACGECHKDIYEQWKGSAHHFASFNNQFYRKSIEYMQEVIGTQPSKWCAGCHDHAMFFSGRFDEPVRNQIDTPEAQAGLACTSCHSIVRVNGSMGNGGFTIGYPPLHELASSRNRLVHGLDYFLTFLNPGPHRRTFMKPFMTGPDSAQFCAACHKVHLDVPVNNYRWLRGFNEYDNWQASGVSGQGARSFYYPEKPSNCADCHMPLVPSRDPGNKGGKVRSHRFPGANVAIPFVNRDQAQMQTVLEFLKSGFVTVDIFAVAPFDGAAGAAAADRVAAEAPRPMSSFAVGEEAEGSGPVVIREVSPLAAPIDRVSGEVQPGSTVRVDVVVRTRGVGHFFPGGTVDAFDVWLEFQTRDATGRIIAWSGRVSEDGRGPVDPAAHFYRSYQLDAAGSMIDKRNAWQTRSVLYVRLIPPGAADVAHYLLRIPEDAQGPLELSAKLHYRKFSYYYTRWAYAGTPKPNQDPSLLAADRNGLEYSFDPSDIPGNASGEIKGEIPDLPIVTLAEARSRLSLGGRTEWKQVAEKQDRERWNDWGIGLLLQGDLKGAQHAFRKVTEADPSYSDGWLNLGRALIQEGAPEAAREFVLEALRLNPDAGRTHFFKAMIEKADGDYDAALVSLAKAESLHPRDRVVLNQIARILFLKRRYGEALLTLERVCRIDPEDVQMHYTAMLCYRGLGDHEKAAAEEKLFRRFKAEEASQAITGRIRLLNPQDNNERQAIHDHDTAFQAPAAASAGEASGQYRREARPRASAGNP